MDLEKIEQLVKIIEKSSMLEFSMEDGDVKINMSRRGIPGTPADLVLPMKLGNEEEELEEECYIMSPIVGTFYSAPSPKEKAFVRAGDKITGGQTVCIIEAMKLMNEIESEFDCEIEAVLVSNEQKVEYGQPLFRVKKL